MKITLTRFWSPRCSIRLSNGIYRVGDQEPLLHWPENARQAVRPGTAAGDIWAAAPLKAAYRSGISSRLHRRDRTVKAGERPVKGGLGNLAPGIHSQEVSHRHGLRLPSGAVRLFEVLPRSCICRAAFSIRPDAAPRRARHAYQKEGRGHRAGNAALRQDHLP